MARDPNYISIAELAEQVGKTKQWIYRMLQEKPELARYVRVIDGKKKVHKSIIWKVFGVGVETEVNEQETTPETPEAAFLRVLQEQLKEKDKQLAEKDKQIADLYEALRRDQILHGETAARLKETTARLQALEDRQAANVAPEQEEATNGPAGDPAQQQPVQDPSHVQQTGAAPSQQEDEGPVSIFRRLSNIFSRRGRQ
jgi:hypothetical protein